MKPTAINCCLCESRHTNKSAEAWCSICKKAFCNKCRYNHLSTRKNRTHKFISVERYQKESSPESVICKDHDKKSHYFCKVHDEVICIVCSPEGHKTCEGLTTLHEAAKSLKLATIVTDFDKSIKAISGNIQKAITNKTKSLTSLKDHKKKIEEEIEALRNNINDQLNKVQEELANELTKAYLKQKGEIEECLKTLDKGKKEMEQLKEQTVELSQSPSTSIQNFLTSLQIKKKFKEEETSVIDAMKGSKPITLILKPAPGLKSFYDEVATFGTIEIQHKLTNSEKKQNVLMPKTRNATKSASKSVSRVKIQLRSNIKGPSGNQAYTKNCAFKADGQMILTEPENKLLVTYDKKCSFVTSVSVSGHPFDIASINYCTVALTFEKQNIIQIFDTTFNKVSKTIHAKNMCRGIAYMNGQLFVVVKGEGILIMDTLGQIKKTLQINVNDVRFLSASNSRLCFTNQISKTVHCYDLRGKEVWKFQDKTLEYPQGLTLDSLGNAFVLNASTSDAASASSSESSYNVVVISSDGTGSKVVLKRPGRPSGIDFDKKHKLLLLYNLDGSADLYDVI